MRYLYLGEELGGRPRGDELYDDEGHVLYSRVSRSELFLRGIARLEEGIRRYLVAGIRTDGEGWIRPVSTDYDGVLTFRHYRFRDGTDAGVLDVVRMVVKGPAATEEQPENWLVAPYPWQLVSRPMGDEHLALLAPHVQWRGALLGNCSDRVSAEELARGSAGSSLALVLVDDVAWRVGTTSRGNRQVRAVFRHDGHQYTLSITDPVWEQRLRALPMGEHPKSSGGLDAAQPVLLTVSRSRNFDGSYFKLVAAIAPLPERWRAKLERPAPVSPGTPASGSLLDTPRRDAV